MPVIGFARQIGIGAFLGKSYFVLSEAVLVIVIEVLGITRVRESITSTITSTSTKRTNSRAKPGRDSLGNAVVRARREASA
jgi:hypothetical protein